MNLPYYPPSDRRHCEPPNPNVDRSRPTPKQLRYLRTLAYSRGESFDPTISRTEASRRISQLKAKRRIKSPTPDFGSVGSNTR